MPSPDVWLWLDSHPMAWVDDTETLTAEAIEAMACWQFWWEEPTNMVMLVDDEN